MIERVSAGRPEGADVPARVLLAGKAMDVRGPRASRPSGLRITAVHNRATGARLTADEWVLIDNDGPLRWQLFEWELVAETPDRDRPRVYRFPTRLANTAVWSLEPGESIYVFACQGRDRFEEPHGQRPQFQVYWDCDTKGWDGAGLCVYLRSVDGRFATEPFPIPD
jgi:hypothetical protein